jgi:AbrB family looped-hinge helix DNA binding protein
MALQKRRPFRLDRRPGHHDKGDPTTIHKPVDQCRSEGEMAVAKKATTVVSTKGQVVLPKAIREKKGWTAGKELVIEETREGVLLRAARPFAPTKFEDVRGSLSSNGKHLGIEDFGKVLRAAASRRYARD